MELKRQTGRVASILSFFMFYLLYVREFIAIQFDQVIIHG